jgi:hypothetical protein
MKELSTTGISLGLVVIAALILDGGISYPRVVDMLCPLCDCTVTEALRLIAVYRRLPSHKKVAVFCAILGFRRRAGVGLEREWAQSTNQGYFRTKKGQWRM